MEFTLKTEELQALLNTVKGTFGSGDFPALNGIYVSIDENGEGIIRSSNGSEATRMKFTAKVEEEGEALIDGYTLAPIVKTFAKGDVTVKLKQGTHAVDVIHPKGIVEINGLDPADFPEFSEIQEESSFVFPAKEFTEALKQVEFARIKKPQGANDARLSGIGLMIEGESGTLACSDRIRVAQHTFDATGAEDINIVLSPGVISGLSSVSGNIAVRLSQNGISFETNEVTYHGPVVAQKFSDVKRIFSAYQNATPAVIDAKSLMDTLERISIITKASSKQKDKTVLTSDATFELSSEGHLTISYRNKTGKLNEVLGFESYGGEDVKVRLNVDYLLDGLKKIDTDNVELLLLADDKPIVVKPEGNGEFAFLNALVV